MTKVLLQLLAQATMTRPARLKLRKGSLRAPPRTRRTAPRCKLSQKVAVLNAAISTTTKGKELGGHPTAALSAASIVC